MDNTKKPGSAQVAFKWTLIYIVTSIVLTYLWQFLGIGTTSPLRYISFIPFIAFMFLAQKEYSEKLGGFMTFGEGFVAGLLFAVFSGVLGAIFSYIYLAVLSPQVWQQSLDATRAALESKGTLSSDQIDQAMNITAKYGLILTLVGGIVVMPIVGAIISLIGAAIFKKEKSILDIERDASNFADPVS